MNLRKILALVLLAAGVLILVYRGVTYSKKHTANLGSIDFSVKERKRLEIPIWAGIIAIAAGAGLLVLPGKKG